MTTIFLVLNLLDNSRPRDMEEKLKLKMSIKMSALGRITSEISTNQTMHPSDLNRHTYENEAM